MQDSWDTEFSLFLRCLNNLYDLLEQTEFDNPPATEYSQCAAQGVSEFLQAMVQISMAARHRYGCGMRVPFPSSKGGTA